MHNADARRDALSGLRDDDIVVVFHARPVGRKPVGEPWRLLSGVVQPRFCLRLWSRRADRANAQFRHPACPRCRLAGNRESHPVDVGLAVVRVIFGAGGGREIDVALAGIFVV